MTMLLFSYRSCSCLGLWRFGSSYTCPSSKLELELDVELFVLMVLSVELLLVWLLRDVLSAARVSASDWTFSSLWRRGVQFVGLAFTGGGECFFLRPAD